MSETRRFFYANFPGLLDTPPEKIWFDIKEETIYFDAEDAFPLTRLKMVGALGFLTRSADITERNYHNSTGFEHSRHQHTLSVAIALEHILRNSNRSPSEINHGIAAALLHDIATPAGGDAIKAIDPENLDEEKHWRTVLDEEAYGFFEKYKVNPNLLDKIIQNEGTLGIALDIADRIAYTLLDTKEAHGRPAIDEVSFLYKDVKIDEETDQVYFVDPSRLGKFLRIRATNFMRLYHNPVNRGGDYMIGKIVEPLYSTDESKWPNRLTPNVLRAMTDKNLLKFIDREYGALFLRESILVRRALTNLYPEVCYCDSQEQLGDWIWWIGENPNLVLVGTEQGHGFNPGVSYLVQDPLSNAIIPYSEYDPIDAGTLETLTDMSKSFLLYYYDKTKITSPINKVVEKVFG